ncbi:hypothetical protein SISSUDRAFT_1059122 [Sistotremastrum suecicum HHB10207 ss-3]|uniref:Uncharacterized protein n=1 Tax=Sistotremastrum suecicum HHB10207 ss-3 TaxID=1314776 RepID=A0A166GLT8_9AGAM|nr:hypothetical protein SISSUDRAFT_1059122 [Sistotremastrum suecicum HHB10207 ss-3]
MTTSPSSATTNSSINMPIAIAPYAQTGEEDRSDAINRLNARMEASKLSHALRARLGFATFKAAHNAINVPMDELEAKITPPSNTPNAANAKRLASEIERGATPTPRPSDDPSHSLYASILSPPNKRSKPSPIRTKAQSFSSAFPPPPPPIPSPRSRTHRKGRSMKDRNEILHDVPTARDDIKAAATLTNLMFSSRSNPSDGERSLSRTSSNASTSGNVLSADHSIPTHRTATPATPKTPRERKDDVADQEAAELMMFLATSPSPARRKPTDHRPAVIGTGKVLFPSATLPSERPNGAGHLQNNEMDTDDRTEISFSQPQSQSSTMTLVNGSQISSVPFPFPDERHKTPPAGRSGSLSRSPRSPPPASPMHQSPLTPRATPSRGGNGFRLSEYLNVSPSPAVIPQWNGGKRAEARGRRLFEDLSADSDRMDTDSIRRASSNERSTRTANANSMPPPSGLAAGINLPS